MEHSPMNKYLLDQMLKFIDVRLQHQSEETVDSTVELLNIFLDKNKE